LTTGWASPVWTDSKDGGMTFKFGSAAEAKVIEDAMKAAAAKVQAEADAKAAAEKKAADAVKAAAAAAAKVHAQTE
jgi:hypothetical protein